MQALSALFNMQALSALFNMQLQLYGHAINKKPIILKNLTGLDYWLWKAKQNSQYYTSANVVLE